MRRSSDLRVIDISSPDDGPPLLESQALQNNPDLYLSVPISVNEQSNHSIRSGGSGRPRKRATGKSIIQLLSKLNEKASRSIPLKYKIQHMVEPTKSSSMMLKNTNWIVAGGAYSYLMMLIILTSVLAFLVDSMPQYNQDERLFWVETVCVACFTIDITLRVTTVRSVIDFCRKPMSWLDILSILPYYLDVIIDSSHTKALTIMRVVRLIRILRVLKFTRYNAGSIILLDALKASRTALSILGFFLTITVLVCSTAVYYAEMTISSLEMVYPAAPNTTLMNHTNVTANGTQGPGVLMWVRYGQRSPFQSIFEAMWWSLTTLTTVGYGDVVPLSTLGKVVGGVTMILGVLVIALPVVLIGNNFQEAYLAHIKKQLLPEDSFDEPSEAQIRSAFRDTQDITWRGVPKGLLGSNHSLVTTFRYRSRQHSVVTFGNDSNIFYYTPLCNWQFDNALRQYRYTHNTREGVVTLFLEIDTAEVHRHAYEAVKMKVPSVVPTSVSVMPVVRTRVVVLPPDPDDNFFLADIQDRFLQAIMSSDVQVPSGVVPVAFMTNTKFSVEDLVQMLPFVNMSVLIMTAHNHCVEMTICNDVGHLHCEGCDK
eukprot:PhF_6_TR24838/c0_g1_i1/m.34255/K04874/KCNA1; potassium voltage-gated channel Shaker-related subfamily A member 1